MAREYEGRLDVKKINVDKHGDLAQSFGVRSIPALFFLKDDEVVDKSVGLLTKEQLKRKIEAVLN